MTERERLTTLIKEAQERCICTEELIDYLLANGVMVSPWISTAEYTPELNEIVIAIVNGKYKNIEFIDAIQLCEYTGEGWIVTEFPEFENAEVYHWMHLPPTPNGRSGVIRRVDNTKQPAADVVEVRHGEWVRKYPKYKNDGIYFCSCCRLDIDIATGDETPTDRGMYYCPNCGAKMDGKRRGRR